MKIFNAHTPPSLWKSNGEHSKTDKPSPIEQVSSSNGPVSGDTTFLNNMRPSEALRFLVRQLNDTIRPEPEAKKKDKSSIDTQTFTASSMLHQQSTSTKLQIETKEGDIVTINIDHASSQSFANFDFQTKGGNAAGYSSELNQSLDVSFSVEGNLNDEEMKSIHQLLGKLNGVAEQLQSGNAEEALHHAMNFNLSNSAISQFTLDMEYSEQTSAVELYQQTQTYSDEEQNSSSSFEQWLNKLSETLDSLSQAVQFAQEQTPIKHPRAAISEILNSLLSRNRDTVDSSKTDATVKIPDTLSARA